MQKNYTKIAVILDRSGSMDSIKSATIEGYNSFLRGQQEVEGRCDISLYQFDDKYEVVYEDRDISKAPFLNNTNFVPRGNTALLDAIGRTVNHLGNKLHKLREQDRPEKVIVVIQTDGYENASQEFSRSGVRDMITHQKEKYNWVFVFLGANQDAIITAQSYGINVGTSITYSSNYTGTSNTYSALTALCSGARCAAIADMQDMSFSAEDRKNSYIN